MLKGQQAVYLHLLFRVRRCAVGGLDDICPSLLHHVVGVTVSYPPTSPPIYHCHSAHRLNIWAEHKEITTSTPAHSLLLVCSSGLHYPQDASSCRSDEGDFTFNMRLNNEKKCTCKLLQKDTNIQW